MALRLLHRLGMYVDDECRLQRLTPYVMAMLDDDNAYVKVGLRGTNRQPAAATRKRRRASRLRLGFEGPAICFLLQANGCHASSLLLVMHPFR